MMKSLDFKGFQCVPFFNGLITQKVILESDYNHSFEKGMIVPVSFDGLIVKDTYVQICNVSITSLEKLTNKDMISEGFLYKKHFYEFLKTFYNIEEHSTVMKLDFIICES